MISELLEKTNQWFEKIPDFSRQNKWWVWGIFIILTALIGSGIPRFKVDESMDAYLQEEDPMKLDMDRFRALFGSDEVAYVIYKAKDGDMFSDASLRAVKELQEELQNYRLKLDGAQSSALDHITDIKTIINASYMEAREDSLVSRNFIGDRLPANELEREKLRQEALKHPSYKLFYLSENTEYGGIMIRTDYGAILKEPEPPKGMDETASGEEDYESDEEEDDFDVGEEVINVTETSRTEGLPEFKRTEMTEYVAFMEELEKILGQAKYTDHLEFHPVGNPPIMTFFAKVIMEEMGIVTVVSLLLIIGCLLLLFRSFSAMFWPVVIVIVTLVWVIGLIGWLGITMTMMVSIIVFLILAVGVADTVHILSGYLFFRNAGQAHEAAMRSVFKKTGLACFMTSVTTSIGMLSLLLVPIVPIKMFGIFAAVGVFLAFVFTIFVLPVMMDLWSPFSKKRAQGISEQGQQLHLIQKILRKVEPFSYKYPWQVFIIFMVISAVLLWGAKDVHIDTNMVNIIKEGQPIRETYKIVDRYMSGTGNMEILVKTERDDGLKDPRVLKAMEKLQDYLKTTYPELITRTSSLAEVTKDSYKALNEGRDDMYIIPEDPDILANTLFMFDSANPKDRRRMVTDDYAMGRISVSVLNAGSVVYAEMIKQVEAEAVKTFAHLKGDYPQISVNVTGSLALIMKLMEYMSWSQIRSFGLALIVISIMLLVIFASKRIGIIAIFPNVFPILSIFGIMGYLGISLDTDTLLVAPITIGIAVDDTIHFLTHYRTEVSKHGRIKDSIIATFRETGQAITFTSIILTVGFLIFLMSSHEGLSNFGMMSAIAFLSALLADLFLLPSMCIIAKARFGVKREPDPA